MATITFDTLAYAKKMKAAGFTDQQAEIQAEALQEIIGSELATKRDIAEVKAELKKAEVELRKEILDTKADIIKWVAGMLVAQAAIVATLVKLL